MAPVNISVNEDTKIGASLLEITRNLARQYKLVVVHEVVDEDEWLANEMMDSRKSATGDKRYWLLAKFYRL